MCIHMHVCILYVCVYIFMYACVWVYVYVCLYVCMYMCVCGCMNKCVYVRLCYAKVRERVDLCFYSTPRPSWPVIGWNWPLTSYMLLYVFCMYVYIFYLFKHAPLLWNNTTCFKSTCYRTSVLTHAMLCPTSNMIASAAAFPLQR